VFAFYGLRTQGAAANQGGHDHHGATHIESHGINPLDLCAQYAATGKQDSVAYKSYALVFDNIDQIHVSLDPCRVFHLEHHERANNAKDNRYKGEHDHFVYKIPRLKRPRDDNQDPCVEMKAAAKIAKRKQQLVPASCTRYNFVKHAAVVLSAYGAHIKASAQI
jgi:hypothetical protein